MDKTFAIYTLGCKVNQEESAALANVFMEHGWRQLPFGEAADVCIINTCTVTQIAEKKSRNMLRRAVAANPAAFVVGTGCYVQIKPEEAAGIIGLDLLLGANEKHRLFALAAAGARAKANAHSAGSPQVEVSPAETACVYQELGNANSLTSRTRAFVKIEDGCNQFCSYCIVPYARGPVRSRPLPAVLAEMRALVAAGYQEIVLTGIHVGAWQAEGQSFADLVAAAAVVPGLARLRLGSVEPREFSPQLLRLVADSPVICPHFHIPLQAASNSVLQAMRRDYDMAYYCQLVADLRAVLPAAAITTDIIAGFPGEDEQAFAEGLRQVEQLAFADAHIFPYSRRPGTPAADFAGQIASAEKSRRAAQLAAVVAESRRRFRAARLGRELRVLLEQPVEREGVCGMQGYTADYLPVFVPGLGAERAGHFVQVKAVRLMAAQADEIWAERPE